MCIRDRPIGVSLNGLEFHSPISNDSIYYGQIEELQTTNSGNNFNVIDPPTLSIVDGTGSGCQVISNFSGSLSEVILDKPGFNYIGTPAVKITGGNGFGARCEAKLKGFIYNRSYTEFDINLTDNKLIGSHRFDDGEEVTYIATGEPIGINSTNVGFGTSKLSSGTSYFIANYGNDAFRLAITEESALSKSNLLEFIDNGTQTHGFKSKKIRKIIDKISVNDSGSSYDKHSVEVSSQQYPPINEKDLFLSLIHISEPTRPY